MTIVSDEARLRLAAAFRADVLQDFERRVLERVKEAVPISGPVLGPEEAGRPLVVAQDFLEQLALRIGNRHSALQWL